MTQVSMNITELDILIITETISDEEKIIKMKILASYTMTNRSYIAMNYLQRN
jgi:hypothetical protein